MARDKRIRAGGMSAPLFLSLAFHFVVGVGALALLIQSPIPSGGAAPAMEIEEAQPLRVAMVTPVLEEEIVEEEPAPTPVLPPPPPVIEAEEEIEERPTTISPEPVQVVEEVEEEIVEETEEVIVEEPEPPAPEPVVVAEVPEPTPAGTPEPEPDIVNEINEEQADPMREQLERDAQELIATSQLIETQRSREEAMRYRNRLLATASVAPESLRTYPRVVCTYSNLLDRLLMLERLGCRLVALHPNAPTSVWTINPRTGQADRVDRASINLDEFSPRVIDPIAQGHGHEFFRSLVSDLANREHLDAGEFRLEGLLPSDQDRLIAFKQRWVMQRMQVEPNDVWATRGHFVYTRQGVAVFVIDALVMRDGSEAPVALEDPELQFLGAV